MGRMLIDIGNTSSKVVMCRGDKYDVVWCGDRLTLDVIYSIQDTESILEVGLSVVGELNDEIIEYFKFRYNDKFLFFDSTTLVPIKNSYKTSKSLGSDRLLAAIAGWKIFEGNGVLVIDLGSAITIDFITKDGEYIGGVISLGMKLRFKALNLFTKKLPLCHISNEQMEENNDVSFDDKKEEENTIKRNKIDREFGLYGQSTNESIESGVVNGILNEIDGYISQYRDCFGNISVVFSGGDGAYFAKQTKNEVFVNSNLVLMGLNMVIDYNVENK